jgi:tetratricopeptide (TPR) repeat protein
MTAMRKLGPMLLLALIACAPVGPATTPNDREWSLITADYQWIQTLRAAQKQAPPAATRKEQIELMLDNHKKIEQMYVAFVDKTREYLERTADPRAGALLAREKIILGDEYMGILARYDKAIALYREALELDPASPDARARIALAEQKRYVAMTPFASVKTGMKEEDVRRIVGVPREDWIKQVVQNKRVYAVWIYPKADGGAAAVYFDNGAVYHTNWNAAAPPARQ